MKRIWVISILLMLFGSTGYVIAQERTKAQAIPPQSAQTVSEPQWEYLVVSFGKTYFNTPTEKGPLSKVVSYSGLGLVLAWEADTVQAQMDLLGRMGWELVGIVGTIGGDQQMVFKRRYDPARSASERDLILKEAAALEAQRKKAQEERKKAQEEQKKQEASRQELVDLDAAEQRQALERHREGIEFFLTTTVRKAISLPIVQLEATSDAFSTTTYSGVVSVKVDVTSQALQGNTYRSSQVKQLLEPLKDGIASAMGPGFDRDNFCLNLQFRIDAVIRWNNEWRQVGSTEACFRRR